MNERHAALALQAIAGGDSEKIQPLAGWLSNHEELVGRYLPADLHDEIRGAAARVDADVQSATEAVAALVEALAAGADSLLAAVFDAPGPEGVLQLDSASVGSVRGLVAALGETLPKGLLAHDRDELAIIVSDPAQGRLGAVRAASWLQTVLGALGLAVYARDSGLTPVAACPTLAQASFTSARASTTIEAATRFPSSDTPSRIDALFADAESTDLIRDATARVPGDLVQQRLTQAARWLQGASSAVSAADAYVLLGVALEIVTGDRNKGAVIERVTRRAATFLTNGAPEAERADLYYDELKRAKQFYELRSRATHGQYDDRTADQAIADSRRRDFHAFVANVCLGFRRHARERDLADDDDFDRWWKRVEINGIFA